jgi:hypothetical protein
MKTLFLFLFLFVLIGTSAYAEHYDFSGIGYRTYYLHKNGKCRGKPFDSDISYRIILDTEDSCATVQLQYGEFYKFKIERVTVSENPRQGTILFCDQGVTFNLYNDISNKRRLLLKTHKVASIFYIEE